MDLSNYLRSGRNRQITVKEKFCLNCGKKLIEENSYLYRQSFCSEKCREEYLSSE